MRLVRSWLGAVLCATLAAVPASAQSAPAAATGAANSVLDTRALRSIETQVEQIRGLSQLADTDVQLLDAASMHNYLVDQFDRDYLPSERESDQKELVALGLLKPTDNLAQIQLDLFSDQVVGVYDPDAKSLFVLADHGAFGPAEQMTYAHEFNHALQDQHFDLNTIAPKHSDNNDHSLAVHAVIEGDAVMLQTLWATANLSPSELIEVVRTTGGSSDSLARAPLILRTELLFPYLEGFSFVRQMYRQAGSSYGAVDDLFQHPPDSTAQLLHPDKYVAQVHPVEVQLPTLSAQLGPDWRQIGRGVLGELDTRVLLEQWGSSHADAARVASGWAGDQWQLVEKDGRSAIVVKSTWETPAAASDFFSAYSRGLRERFDSATLENSSDTRQALTTPAAASDLRLIGNDVLTVIASDRETASAMVEAVTASAP
ncbi:MAG: hypothetical protein ACR2IK_19570 [Chloroflexota bacterium]